MTCSFTADCNIEAFQDNALILSTCTSTARGRTFKTFNILTMSAADWSLHRHPVKLRFLKYGNPMADIIQSIYEETKLP